MSKEEYRPQPEQHNPPQEGDNGAPGLPRTVHESANPPPESQVYPTLPQKSPLSRAVERTRDLYKRNGWVFLPLGEAAHGSPILPKSQTEQSPQLAPPEQAKFKGESELSKLLEEKGLFMADVPEGRDPESYPIEAMKQIRSELTEQRARQYALQRTQIKAGDRILIDKMDSLRESARKVERAFEIIVYPLLQNQELKKNIKKDLLDDTNRYGRRTEIELNDEELEAIAKLTAVRGLPFDSEKRVYEYSQVPGYSMGRLFSRTVFY